MLNNFYKKALKQLEKSVFKFGIENVRTHKNLMYNSKQKLSIITYSRKKNIKLCNIF